MFEVDDGTIADGCKHIVTFIGGTHRLQQLCIFRIVTRRSHQSRHSSSGTRSVGDDALGIARHLLIEVAQIADGGFQVEDSLGRTSSIDGLPLFHALVRLGILFVCHDA